MHSCYGEIITYGLLQDSLKVRLLSFCGVGLRKERLEWRIRDLEMIAKFGNRNPTRK